MNEDISKPLYTLTVGEYMELTRKIVVEVLKEQEKAKVPKQEPEAGDETFNIRQLAKFLRCSLVSIHNYKKAGLPFYRIGRKTLFKKNEVMAFMSQKLRKNFR